MIPIKKCFPEFDNRRPDLLRPEKFVALDPGVDCGVVVMNRERLVAAKVISGKGKTWEHRCTSVCEALTDWLYGYTYEYAFVERPVFMDTMGGRASARSDSLMKLGLICGRQFQILSDRCASPKMAQYVDIVKWKGQLPKAVVNERIRLRLPKPELRLLSRTCSHDWDAAGIGLYLLGRL